MKKITKTRIVRKEAKKEKCPLGICDGSGIVTMGEFDSINDEKCPHTQEETDEYDAQLD